MRSFFVRLFVRIRRILRVIGTCSLETPMTALVQAYEAIVTDSWDLPEFLERLQRLSL